MERYRPKRVIIEQDVAALPLTQTMLQRLEAIPREFVTTLKPHAEETAGNGWQDAQDTLLLSKNKGRFFEPCPCTKHYLCCSYYILNLAANCHINCSYCILQAYLNNPFMVIYTNTAEMFVELDKTLSHNPDTFYRIGTGEYTDSLVVDHLTSFSRLLVPHFAEKKNAVLELKTKTDIIENLEGLEHGGRTVVAWSLNAEPVIKSEETYACSLEERLDAARICVKWGYPVAFHFDPLMYYPGWQHDYEAVVARIFQTVDPSYIRWISLGCFRFMPKLKQVVVKRYPSSRLFCQEFIRGLDGKMRYFKPIRIEMYTKMAEWIKGHCPGVFIYLCMESSEVWEQSLGFAPASPQDLNARMAHHWLPQEGEDGLSC